MPLDDPTTSRSHPGFPGRVEALELALERVYGTARKDSSEPCPVFVWRYPACSFDIHLSFPLIDRMRHEILGWSDPSSESGGLLFANQRSSGSDPLKISDFIPLPKEYRVPGPYFQVDPSRLGEFIGKRCPPDKQVIGYYRSASDRRIHLREKDIESTEQSFKDPSDVVLVIACKESSELTAGFFVRHSDSVATDWRLVFPFSTAELGAAGWPVVEEKPASSSAGLFSLFRSKGVRVAIGIGVGLIAVFATMVGLRLESPASISAPLSPVKLGLQVTRDGDSFVIRWDPHIQDVANASKGTLQMTDGSGPSTFLSLNTDQVLAGSLHYASPSFGDRVEFRLEVSNESGVSRGESTISASGRAVVNVPATEQSTPQKPISEKSRSWLTSPGASPRIEFPSGANRKLHPGSDNVRLTEPSTTTQPPHDAREHQPSSNNLEKAETIGPQGLAATGAASASRVTITSDPSTAKVEINGTIVGYTPITIKVMPVGLRFSVTVSKNGFAEWATQTYSTAQPLGLHAQLRELPK